MEYTGALNLCGREVADTVRRSLYRHTKYAEANANNDFSIQLTHFKFQKANAKTRQRETGMGWQDHKLQKYKYKTLR
jgi:hypothetical protein